MLFTSTSTSTSTSNTVTAMPAKRLSQKWLSQAIKHVGILICLLPLSMQATAREVGAAAPDFTLKSRDGTNLKLTEQVGNVLLINFWASWCGPCRQEMPLLETLHQKYKDLGFSVVAINVDENSNKANEFLSTVEVTFPVLYDRTAKVSQLYEVDAMPTTVLVDRDGNMRFFHKSFKPGYEAHYEQEVKTLVRE